MALQNVPWAIGNGAHNPVEGARLSLYAATNGATGVMGPTDMRVTALPVPGGAVRVHTGACVAKSRYPGASGQSYAMRETSSTDVAVTATGSSGGATRYLVARVHDHQYTGEPTPADVKNGPYNAYEWLAQDPRVTPPAFPVTPLIKVVQPANTATITNAMIEDIREVANPRTLDVWRPRPNIASDNEWNNITGPDGEWFPNSGGEQSIYIPEWATRVQISATWIGIRYMEGRNPYGECWVEFGPYLRPSTRAYSTQRFMYDSAGAVANTHRVNWIAEDDRSVPADIRGTTQVFVMKARKVGPDTGASIDGMSGVSLKVRFLEVADPSTS